MKIPTKSYKDCQKYYKDYNSFAVTGKANDEYIDHLSVCNHCQSKLQSLTLPNIKALDKPKRI